MEREEELRVLIEQQEAKKLRSEQQQAEMRHLRSVYAERPAKDKRCVEWVMIVLLVVVVSTILSRTIMQITRGV